MKVVGVSDPTRTREEGVEPDRGGGELSLAEFQPRWNDSDSCGVHNCRNNHHIRLDGSEWVVPTLTS